MKYLRKFSDDILLMAGCASILYGLAQINIPLTWISGGIMLIGLAVLIGKAKA